MLKSILTFVCVFSACGVLACVAIIQQQKVDHHACKNWQSMPEFQSQPKFCKDM